MSGEFRIETERLILREFNLEDVDKMFELNSDEEVVQFTGDKAFADKEEVRKLIVNYDQYRKYNMGRWTLILKSTNEYIGWCGLKYLAASGEVDLGFRLMKKYWNHGYATESSKAALDYGFDNLKLKKIIGRAAKENTRSIRVLGKLGMVYEKDFRDHDRVCEQYSIFRT